MAGRTIARTAGHGWERLMGKLIDKETTLKSVSDIKAEWGNDNLSLINQAEVLDLIDDQPAVDAVPVVHAHWIFDDDAYLRCNNCWQKAPGMIHEEALETTATEYCPFCGAKKEEVS